MRSWRTWFLPFLISGGMAFGALLGLTSVSDAMKQEGPAGDVAGAAGALMVLICIVMGFIMVTITIIAAKVLRRGAPDHIGLRLGLSIVCGSIIGVLGSYSGNVATALAWLMLVGAPVLLSWSWRVNEC
jgi:hypothetical protein